METLGLEQGCAHHTKNAIGNDLSDFDRQESISLRSIAFSLKRIADELCSNPSDGTQNMFDAMSDVLSEIAALPPEERK